MAPQDDGHDAAERREHDRRSRAYEETTGNPYHLSRAMRAVLAAVALIVVIALTWLFVSAAFHL